MKRLVLCTTLLLLLGMLSVVAQRPALKVGNNPASLNSSAALEVESTEKGFLPPRMTNAQMNAIVNPDQGLIVYCTDCSPVGLRVNNGSNLSPNWQSLGGSGTAASVVANCTSAGFSSGMYIATTAVSGLNFSVTITNNTFATVVLTFAASDLVLSGLTTLGTLAVGTPTGGTNFSNGQANLTAGQSVTVTYPITGSTGSCGTLTGVWTKVSLSCTKTIEILPNINCGAGTWTTAVTPSSTSGLVPGTSYSGTYTIPFSGGVCTFAPESYTINGLTLTSSGGAINATGNITYSLSGTYTGMTGGSVTFNTRNGCSIVAGVPPTSCLAIKTNNPGATDGVYTIDPDGAGSVFGPMSAYCDMTTDGGGWTLIGIFGTFPSPTPTVTSFTGQNSLGIYSRSVVMALANVSSIVQLRSGASSTSYAHKITSTANGLAIQALRNSSTATAGAGTWHNGAWATFTVNSGNWDWSVGGAISPVFSGWPNMYHSSGNGGSVHWTGGGGGRTSSGDPWAATYIK